jgi:hypothetical protein
MRDGHIGTGGVDAMQSAFPRSLLNGGRDAMRGKDDGAFSDLFQNTFAIRSIQRDSSQPGQFFNGMAIMHNLPDNIDGTRYSRVFCGLAYHL